MFFVKLTILKYLLIFCSDFLLRRLSLTFTRFDEYNGAWYYIYKDHFDLFMLEVSLDKTGAHYRMTMTSCRNPTTASLCWSTSTLPSTSSGSWAPPRREDSTPPGTICERLWRTSLQTPWVYWFLLGFVSIIFTNNLLSIRFELWP